MDHSTNEHQHVDTHDASQRLFGYHEEPLVMNDDEMSPLGSMDEHEQRPFMNDHEMPVDSMDEDEDEDEDDENLSRPSTPLYSPNLGNSFSSLDSFNHSQSSSSTTSSPSSSFHGSRSSVFSCGSPPTSRARRSSSPIPITELLRSRSASHNIYRSKSGSKSKRPKQSDLTTSDYATVRRSATISGFSSERSISPRLKPCSSAEDLRQQLHDLDLVDDFRLDQDTMDTGAFGAAEIRIARQLAKLEEKEEVKTKLKELGIDRSNQPDLFFFVTHFHTAHKLDLTSNITDEDLDLTFRIWHTPREVFTREIRQKYFPASSKERRQNALLNFVKFMRRKEQDRLNQQKSRARV